MSVELAAGVADAQLDRLELAEPGHLRLQHRAHRRDDDRSGPVAGRPASGCAKPAQHRQPLADGVGARREPLVRQRLPAGVERHLSGGSRHRSAATRSSASRPVLVTASTSRPPGRRARRSRTAAAPPGR